MGFCVTLLFAVLLLIVKESCAWEDWDKRQQCFPSDGFHQPSSVAELVAHVEEARARKIQVKVIGSGHSFSAITLTDKDEASIMLNLDKINRVIRYPSEDHLFVTVEAGIRVHVLNDVLLEKGFALINTGAIAQQSVAGATQTGTHGTGTKLGSMSTQIVSMDIILSNGTIVTASATRNEDLFDAARVGLGSIGIVVRVTLTVVPKFKLHRVAMPYPLNKLLEDLPSLHERYDRLQWYYTPYSEMATLLLRWPVPVDTDIVPCWPGDVEESARIGENISCTDWSFKALCHEADDAVLYTEMEMFVDRKDCLALVNDFQKYQSSVRNQSMCAGVPAQTGNCSLFTGVRYGKADDIWMSEFYQRDTCVLSSIVFGTTQTSGPSSEFALFGKALEKIAFERYNGRPHYGKMNWATADDMKRAFPDTFDRFKAVRDETDPNGMFMNGYLRRILGE